jgi:rhamnogalacturonan endolyase
MLLTVFEGMTGKALATTNDVPPRRPTKLNPTKLNPTPEEMTAIWGDGTGNRGDRFLACMAYLDTWTGCGPSVVMCRGYYSGSAAARHGQDRAGGLDWRDGKLMQRRVFDPCPTISNMWAIWRIAGEAKSLIEERFYPLSWDFTGR